MCRLTEQQHNIGRFEAVTRVYEPSGALDPIDTKVP